jgi:hypothetical protein
MVSPFLMVSLPLESLRLVLEQEDKAMTARVATVAPIISCFRIESLFLSWWG